jgi:hypothetical protein
MYYNFEEAVDAYLRRAPYLTDEHAPMIMALHSAAKALDKQDRISSNLLAEFTKTSRALLSYRPEEEPKGFDALEMFLKDNAK